MRNKIIDIIEENLSINKSLVNLAPKIEETAQLIIKTQKNNGKVLLCGNGGSAADAQHLAAELVVRFNRERKALAAIALATNGSIMTACANDFGYEAVFKRQVEALANAGDCFIAISTSGKSKSVIEAAEEAKKKGCLVVSLTGGTETKLSDLSDITLAVPASDTPRIQEAHILIGHIICELVEEAFSGE